MNIGILALQGAYVAHSNKLKEIGFDSCLLKTKQDLEKCDVIFLPGGESTTMLYLLKELDLIDMLITKLKTIPVFATCAGLILLKSLNILNIEITRNGYGPQLMSGIYPLDANLRGASFLTEAFFIRAPIITSLNDDSIEVLSSYKNNPVLIEKDKILAMSFHPELGDCNQIYKYFFEKNM